MLQIEGLRAAYGSSEALLGVDLKVDPGEVVCLIGRNGVGKTSTMRAVVQDIIEVTHGSVEFEGKQIAGMASYMINRMGIGYVPQDRRVFAGLTVAENLRVPNPPEREGAVRWTIDKVYALFPQLYEYRSRVAGVMSGGEQQMLSIARSLLTNPKLLLLDEPHEGLAPKVAEEVVSAIIDLKKEGVSMVISEQALQTIKKCADRVYVIDRGMTMWDGTVDAFYAAPEVAEKYLMVQ